MTKPDGGEYPDLKPPVNTMNEWIINTGTNLPNHSSALVGRARYVQAARTPVVFRTKQEVYRFMAYVMLMAELLPDEEGSHTYEQVEEAIRNT